MRLSAEPDARRHEVVEIARQCAVDRSSRKAYHRQLREWFTRGTVNADRAVYNAIRSDIKQLAAYLYAPETTRFSCAVDRRYGDTFLAEMEVTTDHFNPTWHNEGHGLRIGVGVTFAMVYPSVVFKVVPVAGHPKVTLVPDTADICVLESDKPFNDQDALVHFYTLNLDQFDRLVAGHPYEKELKLIARQRAEMGTGDEPLSGTVERMVFDQVASDTTSPVYGGGALVDSRATPEAVVDAPRVTCAELWVVDDFLRDWRVVTCLAPQGEISEVIWSRRTPVLSGVDPFVQLCLDEAPDYTWGFSKIEDVAGLQELAEERLADINQLLKLQLYPPTVLGGFGGLSDERAQRMNTPKGVLATSLPNPTVSRQAPQMPPEAFASQAEIAKMRANAFGLPILLSGNADPSIRAGDQLGVLATLASAQPRIMAMLVERAVSEIATLILRMSRELDPEPLIKPDGKRFLLKQIPRDVVAVVDSHSSSPLFAQVIESKADRLLKSGSIAPPDYVAMLNPPGVDILKAKARKLAEAKAKQAERLLVAKEMQAQRGRSR